MNESTWISSFPMYALGVVLLYITDKVVWSCLFGSLRPALPFNESALSDPLSKIVSLSTFSGFIAFISLKLCHFPTFSFLYCRTLNLDLTPTTLRSGQSPLAVPVLTVNLTLVVLENSRVVPAGSSVLLSSKKRLRRIRLVVRKNASVQR